MFSLSCALMFSKPAIQERNSLEFKARIPKTREVILVLMS